MPQFTPCMLSTYCVLDPEPSSKETGDLGNTFLPSRSSWSKRERLSLNRNVRAMKTLRRNTQLFLGGIRERSEVEILGVS